MAKKVYFMLKETAFSWDQPTSSDPKLVVGGVNVHQRTSQ